MTGHNRIPTRTPFWKFWNPESGYIGALIFGVAAFVFVWMLLAALGVPV